MSAPTIPYQLSPRARAWPAWELIWDRLADGEWHRGADLVEEVLREGVLHGEANQMRTHVAVAAARGLIEREIRSANLRPTTTYAFGPLRPRSDPWYRRPAGDP